LPPTLLLLRHLPSSSLSCLSPTLPELLSVVGALCLCSPFPRLRAERGDRHGCCHRRGCRGRRWHAWPGWLRVVAA
jgi:hypothetical protein